MLFITEVNRDTNEGTNVLVFPESYFEYKDYSNCYGQYGREIGHADAGSCIELTQQHVDFIVDEFEDETYKAGDVIFAEGDSEIFDAIVEKFGEECVSAETVYAYTYHDGHNFCTIVLDGQYPTHEAISEEDAKMFLAIIESEDFCMGKDGPYRQAYKTDEFIFVESNMQGHPEFCYIIDNNEQ